MESDQPSKNHIAIIILIELQPVTLHLSHPLPSAPVAELKIRLTGWIVMESWLTCTEMVSLYHHFEKALTPRFLNPPLPYDWHASRWGPTWRVVRNLFRLWWKQPGLMSIEHNTPCSRFQNGIWAPLSWQKIRYKPPHLNGKKIIHHTNWSDVHNCIESHHVTWSTNSNMPNI